MCFLVTIFSMMKWLAKQMKENHKLPSIPLRHMEKEKAMAFANDLQLFGRMKLCG